MKRKLLSLVMAAIVLLSALASCSESDKQDENTNDTAGNETAVEVGSSESEDENYDGRLVFDHSEELLYAKCFSIDYYKGGYKWIKTTRGASVMVVPEGMSVPEGLDADTFVLQQPVSNIFVASTPVTSLIHAVGALDAISLTTYDADSWYIEDVKNAILDGKITFVGEYKEPDYEKITSAGSTFAIYSTMLTEDVAAQLDSLGVYVMLDGSVDEDHPLARVEWAKVYGAMFNCEEAADSLCAAQNGYVDEIAKSENTGKTVAIFYITSKGKLYARNADDYMAKMVDLAGGVYALSDYGVGETGTVNMEMEAFYDKAKDADYIIYIYSLGGKPETLADLAERSEIIPEMKAYKEGNVWCTTPDFFQITDTIGSMINDIHLMFDADDSVDSLTYLRRLK